MSNRNVGISRHEIEFLFTNAIFNLDQIENMGEICKVLGKYLFVDRTILEARVGNKIGLSYLKKAVKNDIITEMQDENSRGKKDIYYYQLGMGGKYLLDKASETYYSLNILANKEIKMRILTLNYFILSKGYDLTFKYFQDMQHRFFFCNDNIVCYFPKVVEEIEVIKILRRVLSSPERTLTTEDIRGKFNFIPVESRPIKIGSKTKTILLGS